MFDGWVLSVTTRKSDRSAGQLTDYRELLLHLKDKGQRCDQSLAWERTSSKFSAFSGSNLGGILSVVFRVSVNLYRSEKDS